MEYWRNAVDNVITWDFLKIKFLDTRNLNKDALENMFGAIRLHCSSNNNPSDVLKTVIIHCFACRSLYACGMKMFSVADVSGLVCSSSFGSMISQTTFYRKSLIKCRVINVLPLYICIAHL
jgi:hypothetical protein